MTNPRYHRHIRAEWKPLLLRTPRASALRAVPPCPLPAERGGSVPPQAEEWEWGWEGAPSRGPERAGRGWLASPPPQDSFVILRDPGVWAPLTVSGRPPQPGRQLFPPLGVRPARAQHPAAAVKARVHAEPGEHLKAPSQAWSPEHSSSASTGKSRLRVPKPPHSQTILDLPLEGRIGLSECKRLEGGACPTEPAFLHRPSEPGPAVVLFVSRKTW